MSSIPGSKFAATASELSELEASPSKKLVEKVKQLIQKDAPATERQNDFKNGLGEESEAESSIKPIQPSEKDEEL